MVATKLVQGCVYWDTRSGVEEISTLLAKVRMKIGNTRQASSTEQFLLGRDHKLLRPLLRNVLPEDPVGTEED